MEDQQQQIEQEQLDGSISPEAQDQCESGLPGGGAGRRDEVGRSGVYPVSASQDAPPEAPIQPEASWGQGERGAAGYEDSGDSGLSSPS